MRGEACRSFRDGSAGRRCTGVDGVPPVSPLSTGRAPRRQGRAIEASQLQDVMRPTDLRANGCAKPGLARFLAPPPKTQTTSSTSSGFQDCLPRWSALWAPRTGPSAKKLAQHGGSVGLSAKKFAPQAQKHRNWGVFSALGELFRAHAHHRAPQGELFRAQDTATWRR